MNILNHFAVIADGNGRWAKEKGLSRTDGHIYGEKTFDNICEASAELGIKYFTIYGFSTENWSRSQEEVNHLLNLFTSCVKRYIVLATEKNYKMRIIGSRENLSDELCDAINELESVSKNNTGLNIQIAFNYGGRDELVRAMNKVVSESNNTVANEDVINRYMDTKDIPDPDIIVRTGGHKRLSNFLLWQAAYAELFFIDKYWPDFSKTDLEEIINEFNNRDRKFGNI